MSKIEFSKEEKKVIISRIQLYFRDELDQDIGNLASEFLLNFFSGEIGAYHYNRGLYDAQAILMDKVENITEAIYELEKPTEFANK